jgi:surface protein
MSATILTIETTGEFEEITIYVGVNAGSFTVDWGDGSSDTYSGVATDRLHTYENPNSYTVTCNGITILGVNSTSINVGIMPNLKEVNQFGSILTVIGFPEAVNLLNVPNSIPTGITSFVGLFIGCSNINDSNISSWDTSNITDMRATFSGATSFNQSLSGWNVSNVIFMGAMFNNSIFNLSLSSWDVSKVTNMSSMFNSSQFDQSLSSWNVSNVNNMNSMFLNGVFNQSLSTWNVSKVTIFNSMFQNNYAFNGDISNWTFITSSNFTMTSMFQNCTSFDQDLSDWNISKLSNGTNMFSNTPAFTTNFNLTLIGWANLKSIPTTFNSITLGNSNNAGDTIQKDLNNDATAITAYNTLRTAPNAWTFSLVPILCILEGNKILCFDNNKEIYKNIETLTTDDVVITYLHGHKKIKYIYKSQSYNDINNYNQCVYRMEKTNDMIDDLYLTGGHSIMVDDITEEEYNKNPINDQIIDNKKLIPAFVSSKFTIYNDIVNYTCYNLLLDNDGDIYKRYGIYCNGVLIETPNEECMSHHI